MTANMSGYLLMWRLVVRFMIVMLLYVTRDDRRDFVPVAHSLMEDLEKLAKTL